MKKALFAILACAISSIAFAAPDAVRTVTIINHYSDNLDVEVSRNSDILPDIKSHFVLKKNQQVTTRVLVGKPGANEAYLRMTPKKDPVRNAFWGIDSQDIYGYIDYGIAFSWNSKNLRTIIFCTPEVYAQKGSC